MKNSVFFVAFLLCCSCSTQSLYKKHEQDFKEMQQLLIDNDAYFRKEYQCTLTEYTHIRYIISRRSYKNCYKGIDKEKDETITSFLDKRISPTIIVYDDYIAFFTGGSSGFLTSQSEYLVYSATKMDMDYMNGIEVIEFEKLEDNWYYAKTEEDML